MSRYLPPPLMALITGVLMWLVSRYPETVSEPVPGQLWLAILIAAGGLAIMLLAAWQFRRAGTTVNPMRPEDSSELVSGGIYRLTRNPMYLGDVFLLTGWGLYLSAPVALLLIPLFILWIDRFQIPGEEAALEARFGPAYRQYRERVRRWI